MPPDAIDFKAYLRRALAKRSLQKFEEACDDLRQALKIRPDDCGLCVCVWVEGWEGGTFPRE